MKASFDSCTAFLHSALLSGKKLFLIYPLSYPYPLKYLLTKGLFAVPQSDLLSIAVHGQLASFDLITQCSSFLFVLVFVFLLVS